MDLDILNKLGLNKNDTSVYATLLRIGRNKTGKIISETGISSSSVYVSLNALIKRGLVSYQVRNNVKYYQAEMPHELIETSKSQVVALEKMMREIVSLPIPTDERNEINVYQGLQGFKRAYEALSAELEEGEEVNVVTYSNYYGKNKQVRNFFAEFDKDIFRKKCKISMIVDDELKKTIETDRSSFVKKYKFKCLPKEYFNPSCFNVSNSMVVMGVWSKNPVAFTIRNPAIVESFRSNFKFLWKLGK